MQRPLTHSNPISSQYHINEQNVPMSLSEKKKYDVVTSSMSRSGLYLDYRVYTR